MCCREVIGKEPSLEALADGSCVHLVLEAEPRAAASARAFIERYAPGDDGEWTAILALLASELVTNAVVHARTPLEIGLIHDDERVLVSVGDRNLVRPEQQPCSTERARGRGLAIVQSLSDAWGVVAHEKGKSVWFIVERRRNRYGGGGAGLGP